MLRHLSISVLLTVVALPATAGELTLTFIGNEAIHITDGETTLVTDFPYRSGYMGYMSYEIEDVPEIRNGLSLITHFHADHWSKRLFEGMDTKIVAPPGITKRLDPDRVVPLDDDLRAQYSGIQIQAIPMKHMLAPEHYSYLVTWHGVRMYFPGDTETPADILERRDVEVMFITPWLIRTIARQNLTLDCDRLIVYHQKIGEEFPDFQNLRRMSQGEQIRVPFEEDD